MYPFQLVFANIDKDWIDFLSILSYRPKYNSECQLSWCKTASHHGRISIKIFHCSTRLFIRLSCCFASYKPERELSNQFCLTAFVIKNYWIFNLMASSLGNSRSVERVEISSRVPWQTVQRVHQRLGPSGMSRVSNATISWRKTVSPRPFRSAALLLNIAQTIVHLTIYHVKKWLKFQFFCFRK